MKYICKVPNSTADDILTYSDILEHIEKDNDNIDNNTELLYKFHSITASGLLVEWETGETTHEPLDLIAQTDPVTSADCAKQDNL
jgi:hypothetical protein